MFLNNEEKPDSTFKCIGASAALHIIFFAIAGVLVAQQLEMIQLGQEGTTVVEFSALGSQVTDPSQQADQIPQPDLTPISKPQQNEQSDAEEILVKKEKKKPKAKKVIAKKLPKKLPPKKVKQEVKTFNDLPLEDALPTLAANDLDVERNFTAELDEQSESFKRDTSLDEENLFKDLDKEFSQIDQAVEKKIKKRKKSRLKKKKSRKKSSRNKKRQISAHPAKKKSIGRRAQTKYGVHKGLRDYRDLKQVPGNIKPSYDVQDRLKKREGTVEFQAYVSREGRVTQFKLLASTGHRRLDLKTLRAIKNWKFYPGQEGWVVIPFHWNLSGGPQEAPTTLRRM